MKVAIYIDLYIDLRKADGASWQELLAMTFAMASLAV